MSQRLIGHLDVDAFYVAVECARRPELHGQPVVVAGSGPRAVVTTASYAARKFGVGSAMPAAKARRLCPQAHFLPPDFPAYKALSAKLMDIVRKHVECVQVMGLDEAYMDLSALAFPHAAMRRLLSEIRAHTQMICSVGIGPNRLVAKVASDAEKPAGFVVLSREEACERFADRPPRLIPGIGPRTAERLKALDITTIAQLRSASEQQLQRHFSSGQVIDLLRRARFEDDTVVLPERAIVSESRERTFDEDITDATLLEDRLKDMAAELCRRLAVHQRSGRTIAIKVRLSDFSTITRARTLAQPTAEPQMVCAVALELLRENRPQRPVRLLGVRMSGLQGPGTAPASPQGHPGPLSSAATVDGSSQLALPL